MRNHAGAWMGGEVVNTHTSGIQRRGYLPLPRQVLDAGGKPWAPVPRGFNLEVLVVAPVEGSVREPDLRWRVPLRPRAWGEYDGPLRQ